MSYEEKLKQRQEVYQKAQNAKIKCETRLETLNQRKEELLAKCKEKGVNPDEISQVVDAKKAELDELLVKIDQFLPEQEVVQEDSKALGF